MACTYKAPNGETSKLFDKVYNGWGKPNAVKVWSATQSQQFKDWYGDSKVDTNGEPTINENNEFENSQGETLHISDITKTVLSTVNSETFTDQLNTLTSLFEKAGLNIEVALDPNSDSIGSVVTINGVTKLTFNPRTLQQDTLFHEFGHIYVDMLGIDHSVIKRGIEHLKGTDLWNRIAKNYPELQGERLAKEVLTTAIGLEAAQMYDERSRLRAKRYGTILDKIKGWKNWIKGLFETLALKFGLSNNAVKKLAYDLTNSNLRYTLTKKPASYVQQMKAKPDINLLKTEASRLSLTADENYYIIDGDVNRRLHRTTTAIEDIKGKFDRESMLKNVAQSDKPEYVDYKTVDDVARLWADKREEGTGLHLINEMYIDIRGNDGTKGTREDAIKYVLDNLYKPQAGVDVDNVRLYTGMKRELVEAYIDNIADFLDTLYSKGYKLYPEIKVFDEEMGVAGTIDLLIEKSDGTYMIYDFKTKEVGKFNSFYTVYGKEGFQGMEGIASDIANSTANGYALQLSTYALILQRKGFNVTKTAIIPFEGDITREGDEFRYSNVKLYIDTNTLQDPDNVLEIPLLTDKMEEVYAIKEDIEQILENVEESNDVLGSMLDNLTELAETRKWLDELVINIKKSISRLRATADVETSTKYEREIQKLVEKLMVEDEMRAITAYTEYIERGLKNLYSRFFDKFEPVTDQNGATSYNYIKGYDSFTWQDISELEKNNPEKYMEFLGFLINADMFLNQVVGIRKLPFTSARQSNLVLKVLKEHEYKVSDLKNKINRLNQELDMRYVELSSNPLYGGRGVLKNSELFFKAQFDESFFQRHFDALADTHNSYMANVIRMYDYKRRYMEDETNEILRDWDKKIKELEASGSNISRFIDKETAKVIQPIDYGRFYKERSDMFKRVDAHFNNIRDWKWQNSVNGWLKKNVVLLDKNERIALRKRMQKELGEEGFREWLARQTYDNGKKYKPTGAFYKPNPEIYTNATYATYSKAEKEFHAFLTSTLAYLTDHVKSSIVKDGYIPAIPKNEKGILEQITNNIGWRESGVYSDEKGLVVDELGHIVEFLPFNYNNMLAKGEYEKVDKNASEEVKREVSQRNAKEKQRVKEAHAAATNQDLKATMPIFIREAIKNKHKKAMEFELLRVHKSFVDNHKVKLSKGGKPVIDKFKKMAGLEENHVEKTTLDSNTIKHYEDWLRMVFYEQFENDEGTLQKVARVLQNYTSLKGMGFNLLSSINNQVYGSIQSRIEAGASSFFGHKEWNQAMLTYSSGLTSYFSDEEFNMTTKQNAFINYFNIMMDFKEQALGNESEALANRMLRKTSWLVNKAYAFEHASEHNLQNRVLFAMAHSHRLVNGQVISFEDYKRGKLKKISLKKGEMTKTEAKKAIEENKALEKTLRQEFEKHTAMYELFEFKDGQIIPSDKLSKEEIAEFERRVLGVNQYLHGIYNKEDAGTMQQYAIGRLAMQFRKWMRPGWNKRFGNRFGESYWNERRSIDEQGIYVTTAKFFATPILDNWSEYIDKKGTEEAIGVASFLMNTVTDMARFLFNVRIHYHTLNDAEKAGVTRTLLEYATFCLAIGALYLAKDLKGDDDDPPMALMLTIYQLDRTVTELTTYVPLAVAPGFIGGGWFNEAKKLMKSPAATFSTLEAVIKLGKNILSYPFVEDDEMIYQSGVYAGESKIAVQSKKLVPFWNQYERWIHLPQNYKYYKLF